MIGTVLMITMLSLSFIGPSLMNTGYEDQSVQVRVSEDITLEFAPPSEDPVDSISGIDDPSPTGWVEGDFIISFDDETVNHARNPSIAVTPYQEGIPESWKGNIHAVWYEIDEVYGNYEIHYSATVEGDPYKWSGENDDRIISEVRQGKAGGDHALNASVCIDDFGFIHVVWTQQYPDSTWEIHYSRSENNGRDWTSDTGSDIVVSGREKGAEATSPPNPKIAVGKNPNGKAPENALYVAWTENYQNEVQEVHFSRSLDNGNSWLGAEVGDLVLSNTQYANNPCIAATGNAGEIVSVAWEQFAGGDPGKSKEIYFSRSLDYGTDKTWEPEILISDPEVPPRQMVIGDVAMTSGDNHELHIVWDQIERGGKALLSGIYYSFMDGNDWKTKEAQIDRPDGNAPGAPTISSYLEGGKAPVPVVQVTWSELEDEAEFPSMEIHTSISLDPYDPTSWSGLEKDQVLSWPDNDPEFPTDATNPSMVMWENGPSNWEPAIIWDELNNPKTKGNGRSQPNTEIHFLPPVVYTITATSGSYGSISPSGSVMVDEGDDQAFTFAPNSHYHVSDVKVDGSSVGTPSSYTFYTVDHDHTIHVTFSIDYHTLSTSISPLGKGTISRSPNAGSYAYGTTVTLTANPIVGWHFTSWSGSMSGSTNPDTITMYGNRAVTANFAINTFTITASAGTGGTIAPSGAVTVNYGASQGFVISANTGYAIKDVLVDSVSQGAISSHTFVFVTSAHTIEAQFIPKYTKSLVAGWNRISFPLEQTDTSIETVLSSIDAYWDDARFYDVGTWKTYTNGVGGTLTDVDHEMGIWVHVTSSCTLTVTGDWPSSTVISLKTGWNMIGYPAADDSAYSVASLKGAVSAVQLVYMEDWRYQMTELGDSYVLQNGELYWVFVESDTTWTINW